jgi:hypothetical protein
VLLRCGGVALQADAGGRSVALCARRGVIHMPISTFKAMVLGALVIIVAGAGTWAALAYARGTLPAESHWPGLIWMRARASAPCHHHTESERNRERLQRNPPNQLG